MRGLFAALYSAAVYLFFFLTFLYAIAFVGGVAPKAIDTGPQGPWLASIVIDVALLSIFALQHSVMARPRFKKAWTAVVPEAVERSTFVLFASLALALLFWQWRPLPGLVWTIEEPTAAAAIRGRSGAGWGVVLISTFLISHFHLFGVSQGFARMLGRTLPEPQFTTPMFYRWIRHPIYAGFILAFWAEPQMSLGHLLFAVATTGYIFVGIWFEERDLMTQFGVRYLEYRRQAGMLLPKIKPRSRQPRIS